MTQPTDRPEVREAWVKWYNNHEYQIELRGTLDAWLHQQHFIDALTERVKELELEIRSLKHRLEGQPLQSFTNWDMKKGPP